MTIPIHFRSPEGLGTGPELARLAGFLVTRGVSKLWFDPGREFPENIPAEAAAAATAAGLAFRVAAAPGHAPFPAHDSLLEGAHDVLLEAPCVDWEKGRESEKIAEIGGARGAFHENGAREVFLRLVHPDPVTSFNLGRLVKERLGAPIVVSLDGADSIADVLSAGPLLAEGLADAVLALPGAARGARKTSELEPYAALAIERAKRILSSLGLHPKGYELLSCPTCGRCGLDVEGMARETDSRMRALEEELMGGGKDLERIGGITVAVMGCNVNGPGEASAADIGIAGGRNGRGALFVKGVPVRTLPEGELVKALMEGVRAILMERFDALGEGLTGNALRGPAGPRS